MIRLSVSVDPGLLETAAKVSGAHTKTEAIERGLQALLHAERRRQLRSMRGTGYGMSLRAFLRHRRDE